MEIQHNLKHCTMRDRVFSQVDFLVSLSQGVPACKSYKKKNELRLQDVYG